MSTQAKHAPPAKPAPRDPSLRKIPISKMQARVLEQLYQAKAEAEKADAGIIRAQVALNSYASAIQHGVGESRPSEIVGVEPGAGRKHFLVLKVKK